MLLQLAMFVLHHLLLPVLLVQGYRHGGMFAVDLLLLLLQQVALLVQLLQQLGLVLQNLLLLVPVPADVLQNLLVFLVEILVYFLVVLVLLESLALVVDPVLVECVLTLDRLVLQLSPVELVVELPDQFAVHSLYIYVFCKAYLPLSVIIFIHNE